MNTQSSKRAWAWGPRLLAAMLVALGLNANAQYVIDVEPPLQYGVPGQTFSFSGTVTNETGASVQTTDLFLDFFNFDSNFLTPVQLLGSTFASIADGATSAVLPLFTLTLSSSAAFGPLYSVDVAVQDANGSLSDPETVSVAVIPEPSTSAMLLLALGMLVLRAIWSRRHTPPRTD